MSEIESSFQVKPEAMLDFIDCEVYFTALDGIQDKRSKCTAAQRRLLNEIVFCVVVLKDGSVSIGEAIKKKNGRAAARNSALINLERAIAFAKGEIKCINPS